MLLFSTVSAVLATTLFTADVLASDEPVAVVAEPTAVVEAAPAPVAAGLSGKILFRGDAPAPARVDMASDPFCVGSHDEGFARSNVEVGEGGGLRYVFVSITNAPDERYKAPKEAVVLDQIGCTYEPRVFGVMKKQDIEIVNSDDTLHNIHAVPKANKEFNIGMPNKGMKVKKEFKKAEDAILIKCDVHPWMAAYCFSMEHPFFGTTDAAGMVTIPTDGLPDGDYDVALWHKELGSARAKVTVKDGAGKFEHTFSK